MDNKKMEKKDLNPEALDQVAGGKRRGVRKKEDKCHHPHKVRTGNEREKDIFFFWSRHQFEYRCPDCGETFWMGE